MKNRFLKINSLFCILISISFFQLNSSADIDLLELFSNNSKKVIEIENNYEKGTETLIKKLSKFKSEENQKGIQRIYKKIIINHPRSSIAKEASYNRGTYLFNKNKWEDAFKAFSILKEYHPDSPKLDTVIELQYKCAERLMNETYKKNFGFSSSSSNNPKSVPLFISYAKLYPYSENAPLALINAAKVSQSDNEYDTAIASLNSLINNYPESEQIPEAYFLIAHIYSEFIKGPEYDLETTREAIRYCEDFIALFPKHEDIGSIEVLHDRLLNLLSSNRVLLADYYYFNRRNNVAAIIFYNEAITIAPNSMAATEAQKRLDSIKTGIRPTTANSFIKKLFFIN